MTRSFVVVGKLFCSIWNPILLRTHANLQRMRFSQWWPDYTHSAEICKVDFRLTYNYKNKGLNKRYRFYTRLHKFNHPISKALQWLAYYNEKFGTLSQMFQGIFFLENRHTKSQGIYKKRPAPSNSALLIGWLNLCSRVYLFSFYPIS